MQRSLSTINLGKPFRKIEKVWLDTLEFTFYEMHFVTTTIALKNFMSVYKEGILDASLSHFTQCSISIPPL